MIRSLFFGVLFLANTLWAAEEITLALCVGGQVAEVCCQAGDAVKKGDVLLRLVPRDFQNELDEAMAELEIAQARLDVLKCGARQEDLEILSARIVAAESQRKVAESEFRRAEPLVEKRVLTPGELERMESDWRIADAMVTTLRQERAKALAGRRPEELRVMEAEIRSLEVNVKKARARLDDATLRAPFSGIVTTLKIHPHEILRPGAPAVVLQENPENPSGQKPKKRIE
ncbi:MAG: biotin/lipoyl-binding protein [Planctomycetia bacterium]|nr:biotin/lipoyl-binding protein [Planctomycetia bacterium]